MEDPETIKSFESEHRIIADTEPEPEPDPEPEPEAQPGPGQEHENQEPNTPCLAEILQQDHKVSLTEDAFRKINIYSRLVSEIVGHPVEIMGLLIGDLDDTSCTARDAYLLESQDVLEKRARPSSDAIDDCFYRVKKEGNAVVGMWHSHADSTLFHSGIDNSQLDSMLTRSLCYLKNRLELDGEKVPYASSIVVNEQGYLREDPAYSPKKHIHYYAHVAIMDRERQAYQAGDLEVHLEKSEEGIVFDEETLRQELLEGVMYRGTPIKGPAKEGKPKKSFLQRFIRYIGKVTGREEARKQDTYFEEPQGVEGNGQA